MPMKFMLVLFKIMRLLKDLPNMANMDHFEGVVLDYLRADRALFVHSQCCIQLNEGATPTPVARIGIAMRWP